MTPGSRTRKAEGAGCCGREAMTRAEWQPCDSVRATPQKNRGSIHIQLRVQKVGIIKGGRRVYRMRGCVIWIQSKKQNNSNKHESHKICILKYRAWNEKHARCPSQNKHRTSTCPGTASPERKCYFSDRIVLSLSLAHGQGPKQIIVQNKLMPSNCYTCN